MHLLFVSCLFCLFGTVKAVDLAHAGGYTICMLTTTCKLKHRGGACALQINGGRSKRSHGSSCSYVAVFKFETCLCSRKIICE